MKYYKPQQQPNPTTQRFIFATGIECSYPTIQTPHRTKRVDEMEKCHHYERWREDFELTRELGIRYLRYGPPYYRIHVGPARYDWSWTDLVLPEMRRQEIVPIMITTIATICRSCIRKPTRRSRTQNVGCGRRGRTSNACAVTVSPCAV
jgi:hypothetical protein